MKSTRIKTLLHVLLIGIALLSLTARAGVEITYIHNDALGSSVAGTDEQGNVKWRSQYQPYGEERLGERSLFGVRSGYTGHREDVDSGLVYMGARYYSPEMGRFMAVDPVGVSADNIHSFNRYAYANNNPYKYIDPDGQEGREFYYELLGDQDPSAGQISWARQVGDGASEFADELESTVTDPTNAIPGVGIFGGIFKKVGGKFLSKALTKQQQKGIRSLEKRIAEHEEKLQEFKDNPTIRPGMENLPKEVIQRQQQIRIQKLENEINTFKNNIVKIKRGELDS